MEQLVEKRKMCIELPIRIKAYDTDYMKIVNNTVYVRWFEDLRTAMLDEYFPLEEMVAANNTPIISETNIKYHRPLTLNNKPTGRVWLEELKNSKWVACFEIFEGDKVFCTGKQTGYYFSMETNRPARFPESMLEKYAAWIDD
ncbi:acyl-CoA thioesterase [Prolixibacteraceae bacterium JC049]|nr:acyl-CoA thioesterase [Prolixibacteraceae bacterium JC049]